MPSAGCNWRIDLTARVPKPERLIASTFRDVYPQYSPDGSRIAFQSTRGEGRSQIWVGDAEARQVRQLTFVKLGLAGSPHWSPDGRTLTLDSNATGHYQVYTINPDGGRMNQLTNDRFDNFSARRSRDGRWLYFTSTRTGRTEVWKVPAAGGPPVRRFTHNGGEFGIESEDGKATYFTRTVGAGSGSIWKMPIAGGQEEQLADSLYRSNYAVAKRGIYYMTRPDEAGNCMLKFHNALPPGYHHDSSDGLSGVRSGCLAGRTLSGLCPARRPRQQPDADRELPMKIMLGLRENSLYVLLCRLLRSNPLLLTSAFGAGARRSMTRP